MQFRKKLVFSMVSAICKFGITYILPNNSWFLRCFRSVMLVVYAVHAQCMQRHAVVAIRFLAARAIRHGARWYVGVVSFSVSGCAPHPPPPRGAGKTGRPLSGRPIRYTPRIFETSRQTFAAFPHTSRSSRAHLRTSASRICSGFV